MSTDTQLQTVVERVEAFLADHDPKSMDDREFRGARFDAGLAWVHFPEGLGGLGFRPDLNREIEKRMRSAG
ncbi:MAG: acyl-CoA dehydrogenase, partial [Ilumatobacteraceae bacterium]